MNVDLLELMNINPETTYAFGKADDGKVYEYKFQDVPGVFFVKGFHEFVGAGLLQEDTLMAGVAIRDHLLHVQR